MTDKERKFWEKTIITYEKKQEESQNKTWKITISEHQDLDITVTAKSQHDVEKMAELLSEMGRIEMRRVTK